MLLQITVMRPPNYTMLTLWAAVVIVVLVLAYWRKENLSVIYNSQNWAVLAIVSVLNPVHCSSSCTHTGTYSVYGVRSNVESY